MGTPELARIYAAAGLDFIFIDMEHSAFSMETVASMIGVARLANIVPIVRVPNAEYHFVARALDAGALGIIIPRLTSADQVERVVDWTRYPPDGSRGIALTPSQTDYEDITPGDFIDWIHRETLLIIQIERKEALDNLEDMLSVPGVDVAALGWMDMSVDLGIPGQIEHPLIRRGMEALIDSCQRHGLGPGLIAPDIGILSYWADRGARFLSYSSDAMILLEAVSSAVNRLKGKCEGEKNGLDY